MSPSVSLTLRSNRRLLFVLILVAAGVIPTAVFKTVRTVSAAIAPAPDVQSDFVRLVPLTANEVLYSPTTKMLYATVPSSVGAGGNSIKTIDPTTGAITGSVFMGSEPNRLAIASDGTTLYAGLDGSYSVRRFDAATQTAGAQIVLGSDSFNGPFRANDLAVAPGNPNLLTVVRRPLSSSSGNIAVYDNGLQRPTTAPASNSGSDFLAFSAVATKLYDSGSFSGLTTLTINANGISVAGNSSVLQNGRIKFDNGLLYAVNGQVIDPDTSTLKGTFNVSGGNVSPTAFVPDSTVGRAYYLVNDFSNSSVRPIRVFDLNTFVLIGTINVSGVNGDVTNMVRWGSNGLAFRTTNGQLFIVQSSLIPSADPIPSPTAVITPTPTPTPTPPATFVRQIPLATNDMIYSAGKQSLYASVPSSAGITGNTITPIDPVTATVGTGVFVGSEPNKLAVADDQNTMYVGLNGAGAVRRFDLTTQTAGLQFALGFDSSSGMRVATGLAVMPGAPGTIAVNRSNSATVIYDDAVPRPQTQNNTGSLAFRSASTLYAANGAIARLGVGASGVSFLNSVPTNSSGIIVVDNGLAYLSGGAVLDPETGLIKGIFTNTSSGAAMAVDSAAGRIYFITDSGGPTMLRAFDINTFLPLGSVAIGGLNGASSVTSLVRWGSNGLAFRTSTTIFLVQTALVSSADPIPAATPTPSPVPSPSPAYIPTFVRKLDLAGNDLVFNQATQRIYASVPGYQISSGNSITTIDPQTAAIGPSVFIGSEPNKLALGSDNTTLYANLDGAAAIRRFDIATQTAGLQFTPSPSPTPADMKVMPGSAQTLAISLGSNNFGNAVSIFDNGVKRSGNVSGNYSSTFGIEFNGPSTIYGIDSNNGSLLKFTVSPSGVAPTTITNGVFSNSGGSILKFVNGLLYSNGGRIVEPETPKAIGTLQGAGVGGNFVVDGSLNKAFFVSNNGFSVVLTAYDLNTFVPLGSVTLLPNTGGSPGGLVRWGANGLAFRVAQTSSSIGPGNPQNIYLVQSALISGNGSIPTAVQFSSATNSVSEGNGTVTITVNRSGDVSSTTTVDYATSDGTAIAGTDYTATSGTLTFTPGQLSKTFTVPIIDDKFFEGANETFNIALGNASSGVVLGSPSTTVVTIQDNESSPFLSVNGIRAAEGNSGTKVFTIPATLSVASTQTISINYATADVTAIAGSDYVATSGTLTFPPGTTTQNIVVTVNGDTTVEPDETFLLKMSNPVNISSFTSQATVTIANDDTTFQFSSPTYSGGENSKSVTVTATRLGDVSTTASVNYSTSDAADGQPCATVNGNASSRCDYVPAFGVVTFGANVASKQFTILLVDDGFTEGDETFTVALSNPTVGTLGTPATATITIIDDDVTAAPNPVDAAPFFVRQNYLDFLNREPDQLGFDFWTGQITACGNDAACVQQVRINVSAAFFQSIEFQQTGYLVERMYKVAYGDGVGTSRLGGSHQLAVPIVRFNEFLQDTQRIGRGVVVLQTGWEAALEANKQAYALEFVQTARFTNAFPTTMTPADFVDKLNQNAGNVLSQPESQALVNLFNGAADSGNTTARSQALRRTAENDALYNSESVRAFVLAQYFGYLRRNPADAPDTDYTGYEFWLRKLIQFNGDYIKAEMVNAFLSSSEFRQRFGQ
ncbi:MAG TPA: Calx-beta domain-containing protein [Pyrinomonadaceae bacterium]|nr:Calx-beta domain-containing protein [Pyrinomonadaceae bacterium]